MNNSIDQLYRSIFNSLVLSKRIYSLVHEVQYNHNSLRYNDIVDVKWMIKYNHTKLLRDKVQRDCLLLNHGKSIHRLVNKDIELFKTIIMKYKCCTWDQEMFTKIIGTNNYEAVKWVCEMGFGVELDDEHMMFNEKSDPKILDYLLGKSLYKVTFDSVVKIYQSTYSKFTLPILDVFKQYTPTPIVKWQADMIVNVLLKVPIPNLFMTLSPLFQENIKLSASLSDIDSSSIDIYPILCYLKEKDQWEQDSKEYEELVSIVDSVAILVKVSSFVDAALLLDHRTSIDSIKQLVLEFFPEPFNNENNERMKDSDSIRAKLFNLSPEVIELLLDHGLEFQAGWFKEILEFDLKHLFISLWNIFKKRDQVSVTPSHCYFRPNPQHMDQSFIIHNLFLADIQVIEFLLNEGVHPDSLRTYSYNHHMALAQEAKTESHFKSIQEFIKLFILDTFLMLSICIQSGNIQLFHWIRPLTGGHLISRLIEGAVLFKNIDILNILTSNSSNSVSSEGIWKDTKHMKLKFLKEYFASLDEQQKLESLPLIKGIKSLIDENRYEIVKFLLANVANLSIKHYTPNLVNSNLAMVDLFYQNRDTLKLPSPFSWDELFKNFK
ncbi:hypothetical protein CYY_009529 [Polysphondylium violaceum]|uniref:Uncharacterized protein n=1 Tax=Polysphondylium violaceum TaxID=133409 RepID=A0A8J4UPF0_9MYCE|nr:hypothetical protein CYY_009529 [Polysphondylium violaceum]